MPRDFSGLKECGDFGQIKEWFLENQEPMADGRFPIRELVFYNVNFGPLDGTAPRSWDGGMTVRSFLDIEKTADLFKGSDIEIIQFIRSRYLGNLHQHRVRFVMLGEEWTTMLMMQELLRSGPDYPALP